MKKLYRSPDNAVLAGICAGLAETLNVDPVIVRLAVVFLTVISGFFPLIITYIAGWILIPEKDEITDEA